MATRIWVLAPFLTLALGVLALLLGDSAAAGPCPPPDAGGC
jgi:hypothetical protein